MTNGTTDGLRHLLGALPPGAVAIEDPGYRAAVETVVAARPPRPRPSRADADHRPRRTGGRLRHARPPAPPRPGDAGRGPARPARGRPARRRRRGRGRLRLGVPLRRGAGAGAGHPRPRAGWPTSAPPPRASRRASGSAGWCRRPGSWTRSTQRREATHEVAPWPVQRAFLSLLRDGYVDKVVRTARRVYADRAPRVAAALSPYAELAGPLAGMYSAWLMPGPAAVRAHRRGAGRRLRHPAAGRLLPLRRPDRPDRRVRRGHRRAAGRGPRRGDVIAVGTGGEWLTRSIRMASAIRHGNTTTMISARWSNPAQSCSGASSGMTSDPSPRSPGVPPHPPPGNKCRGSSSRRLGTADGRAASAPPRWSPKNMTPATT